MTILYENEWIYIEQEEADIPWLKIFAKEEAKELTDCSIETQYEIFRALLILEKEMIQYFQPDKINIASFANYLPKVHWHIMARYKKDSHFPEPMWGVKQREADVAFPEMDGFIKRVAQILDKKT
ncbi:MAG: HIT family protein [Thiotrichaceae bacterium]